MAGGRIIENIKVSVDYAVDAKWNWSIRLPGNLKFVVTLARGIGHFVWIFMKTEYLR